MEDLNRFVEAQEDYFDIAYEEIKTGKKKTHWMWYIFPQIHGLGYSETSIYYSIKSINEAISYLNNEYLYNNMIKICNLLLNTKVKNPANIFGGVDSLKLRSSMTLFYLINTDDFILGLDDYHYEYVPFNFEKTNIFKEVLDKFYNSIDEKTILIINKEIEDEK